MFLLKIGVVLGPFKYETVFDGHVLIEQLLKPLRKRGLVRETGGLLREARSV